jgi:hypothetical protein
MLHLLVRRLQQPSEVGKLIPSWISPERKMQEKKVKMCLIFGQVTANHCANHWSKAILQLA